MNFGLRISNGWRCVVVVCLLMLASSGSIAYAQSTATKAKKVTVTLVRWPYT